MNSPTIEIMCEWCGRSGDSIKVFGASSLIEAREAALIFAEIPQGEGITLYAGFLKKWPYDEPQPSDWQDYFVFRSIDEYEPDQREWWEK